MRITQLVEDDVTSPIIMEDVRSISNIAPNSAEAFLASLRGKLNIDAPIPAGPAWTPPKKNS